MLSIITVSINIFDVDRLRFFIKKIYSTQAVKNNRIGLAQNAREAFESWLKLLDKIDTKDLGINIRVDWTGEDNLSDDELVDYMVEIMLKSGVGPKVSEEFDSVKAVRKGWV